VGVGLVAHVPDDAVFGRVEDVVQGDGQLYRAKVGREVAARSGDGVDQEITQRVGEGGEFAGFELAQVCRRADAFQQVGAGSGGRL
jgi:hypothetical protein